MLELLTTTPATGRRPRWQWLLALGVVLLLLGLAAAGFTTFLELTSLLVFGPLLLASSLIQFLTGFIEQVGRPRRLHYAAAGVEAVLGFLVMIHPLVAMTDLVVVVAVCLMVVGLLRLARSLAAHSPGRRWALLAGGGGVVLGVCLCLRLPVSRLWLAGLCLALDFLCHGVSWSAAALAERGPLASEQARDDP